jgi:hypothetical protein
MRLGYLNTMKGSKPNSDHVHGREFRTRLHQVRNEVDVAGKSIQLGDYQDCAWTRHSARALARAGRSFRLQDSISVTSETTFQCPPFKKSFMRQEDVKKMIWKFAWKSAYQKSL